MSDFDRRFSAAKSHRAERVDDDGYEAYTYCFNGRECEWLGRKGGADPVEIFADQVASVAEEFAGEMFSTMTPENTPWVEYEAGSAIPEEVMGEAMQIIEKREKLISKSLRASNYYDEAPTAFLDVNLGTVALWADRLQLNEPITFEAVPISEIYLRLGPRGIDDRFRKKKYYYRDLPELFPDAKFSRDMNEKIKRSKGKAEVIWGFWKDYSDPGNPIWVQSIRVDKEEIGLDDRLEGDGSCPLLVGRFNPQPNSAWGWGPAFRMLPTLRVYDTLVRMNLENMDRHMDPAYAYPHDGMLDLSEGIEAGLGYPSMPGSPEQIRALGIEGNLDYGFFSEDKLREVIRDGFYREIEQRGKTPPSATQFMGQEQKQIRRMARPAGKLWRELGVGVLKRVEYLEAQPGGMLFEEGEDSLLLENGQTVTIRPISPLERAQAREEVLTAQSIMGMAQEALGPEQAGLVINGPKTMTNVKAKLKDQLVEFRSEEELAQMMQQMQQMQQGAPDAQPQ